MDHRTRPSLAGKPTLDGERVLLRPVVVGDVAGLRDMLDDPEGRRLTGTHAEFTEQELYRWYASRGQQADRLDLAVVERASGEYAGEVVLNDLDAANRSCSFRIELRPRWRGRGLGTEATRLLLAHGFQTVGLHRISLEVYAFNPRAQAVYERVGFRVEGVLRDALYWDGGYVDAIVMSMLAPEWNHRYDLST